MEKVKPLILIGYGSNHRAKGYMYNIGTVYFGYAQRLEDTNNLKFIEHYVMSCREVVISHYNDVRVTYGSSLCFIIYATSPDGTDKRSDILNSLKIINMYEEYLGWEKTKYIELEGDKNTSFFWMQPNDNWLIAPQTMSLFLLLARSGHVLEEKGMQCPHCIVDAVKFLEANNDKIYYTRHYDKFLIFLENLEILYKERNLNNNFSNILLKPNSDYDSVNFCKEGIDKLFLKQTRDVQLKERWNNVLKEIHKT